MPAMGNITVKKNDGSTDILYTAKQPSSGNGVAAIWQSDSVGTAVSHRPELRVASKDTSNGRARSLNIRYSYPMLSTSADTGLTSVVDRAWINDQVDVPNGMKQTDVDEFVAQYANLLKSAILQACMKERFAPQ